ncbi:MAG: plastocyanin/azurin family copper-binding protein [Bacteroidia bacterium]|jgi:plastocyanin
MKTISTLKTYRFWALSFLLAYLSMNLNAQTSHAVAVTSYKYTPANLTITQGDEVVWTNTQGFHNVDGKTSVYPSNPESFGNSLGSGWSYKFTFNTPGTYSYQCDPHVGLGMVGTIVVSPKTVTSIQTLADLSGNIQLYPNPASESVQLKLPANYPEINSLKVYSMTGSLIDQKLMLGNNGSLQYDVSHFKKGMYFLEITAGNRKDVMKFLKQ